jgi:hypothetical protein
MGELILRVTLISSQGKKGTHSLMMGLEQLGLRIKITPPVAPQSKLFVTEHGALPVALANAKTIVLTVTTLPTSLLFDDDLKTWARGCT